MTDIALALVPAVVFGSGTLIGLLLAFFTLTKTMDAKIASTLRVENKLLEAEVKQLRALLYNRYYPTVSTKDPEKVE